MLNVLFGALAFVAVFFLWAIAEAAWRIVRDVHAGLRELEELRKRLDAA